ncbi:MAG TPA: NAD(P)-binding domain-containing protein [Mycobacteriales bacterium]|nr:NAD(P)-binding domain-containing protein [Mycobacteriales bacterium]
MRIGVLGTGTVGHAVGTRLVDLGHEVRMGSRTAANPAAVAWAQKAGSSASFGTFRDAAEFGEVLVNCTVGAHSVEVLTAAGVEHTAGKLLIDISNPIDLGELPSFALLVCNTDSLGERIQLMFPAVRVVKALNTINADVMVQPELLPGDHVVFICGNDPAAKVQTVELLGEFGWPAERVVDLGDISAARATEMYLTLWVRLYGVLGTAHFNVAISR